MSGRRVVAVSAAVAAVAFAVTTVLGWSLLTIREDRS